MRPVRTLALLAAALLASACASTGALKPVVPASAKGGFVDARAGAVTSAPLPDGWWRLYDDPTLDALVTRALTVNKDLAVAAANLAQVRASLHEAQGQLLPTTTVSRSH